MKTKVIFKKRNGEIFAFFPEILEGKNMALCYAHIGQHSACHLDYARRSKEANFNQYWDLLRELVSIGYKLEVLNKQKFEYHRNPTNGEIKFGHGALHYKSFTLAEIGLSKKGDLKSWFVSDGLRYYR